MANTKASKQDIKTIKRNRERNLAKRAELKSLFKDLQRMEKPSAEELKAKLNKIYQLLDRYAGQIVHPSKASRLKSRAAAAAKSLANA